MDFEFEKLVGYLVAGAVGSVVAYFQKIRKDLTCAHKKIRKLQNHLGLDENGESKNGK